MSDLIEQGIAERDRHRAEPQTQPSGLAIEVITKLARSHRLVAMAYHKLGESEATVRVVEPYSVETTPDHYLVRCWQVHPPPSDGDNWRTFRLDRIADVCVGGGAFQPREPITLGTDDVRPFKFE